jgi:hypothetical protein
MFPCPKRKCDGVTDVPKTLRQGWRGKGTLRKIVCKKCGTKFETVELLLGTVEATIRAEANRLATQTIEAFKDERFRPVTRTPKTATGNERCTSPRLPAYKRRRA